MFAQNCALKNTEKNLEGGQNNWAAELWRIRFSGKKGNFLNSALFGECLSLQVEFLMLRFKCAALCFWKEGVLCDHFYRCCICQFLFLRSCKAAFERKTEPKIICLRYLSLSKMAGFQHLIISICEPGDNHSTFFPVFTRERYPKGIILITMMWTFKEGKDENIV